MKQLKWLTYDGRIVEPKDSDYAIETEYDDKTGDLVFETIFITDKKTNLTTEKKGDSTETKATGTK